MSEEEREEKKKRVRKEYNRIKKIYKDMPPDVKTTVDSLIHRAAFMRVSLEDMEADLDERGFVEFFSQSEKTEPYERERPVARLYNTLNKNYQSIMKQLSDLVPKPKAIESTEEDQLLAFLKKK
ncbi:hypothetical protein OE059_04760 [Exiguobacterium profundum]|uniref:P27 family phage terminase small subunit n=1 Tax=Exiguobacterium profundum TaxID=307643 RepID=A0ABY8B6D7_9BACL|nr:MULTISPECIES: hypothetical protein [Exiguobacterium]MCV9899837.1 hypothetical protein [Exiguobacterium sp. N5]WED56728.1 hypothetical protein OE059_04760 [Exiguobacterium profundum]